MSGFNIIALNKNYEIVSLIRFTNLQWTRKYHESGIFSVQIPLEQYSNDFLYIYTKERPEMGKITQVNYVADGGFKYIQLSGYFLERELNRRVVYPLGAVKNIESPAWVKQSGKAEDVAYQYFNDFKNIAYTVNGSRRVSELGISTEESLGRGNVSEDTRNGEYLGDKIYQILKPSGMSYRVKYNFLSSEKVFEVWSGLDRTADNENNNPIIFSTKYGNIKKPNILIDKSTYKNAYLVKSEASDGTAQKVFTEAGVLSNTQPAGDDSFLYFESSANRGDFSSDSEYVNAIMNEAYLETANNYKVVMNVEFEAMEGSYEYMTDFDIGDLCSLEIPEMGLTADVRLIGCYEVIKGGSWTMSLEFGTPIIKK